MDDDTDIVSDDVKRDRAFFADLKALLKKYNASISIHDDGAYLPNPVLLVELCGPYSSYNFQELGPD